VEIGRVLDVLNRFDFANRRSDTDSLALFGNSAGSLADQFAPQYRLPRRFNQSHRKLFGVPQGESAALPN
jgi:hypothetical protein